MRGLPSVLAFGCAFALIAYADEPKAAAPSGISTATPAVTARPAATPVALTPQQIRTITTAQLELVLSKSLSCAPNFRQHHG